MAIKGKTKSRSKNRKSSTSGPKPSYVTPRRPPLERRSVQITIAVIAVAALVFGLLFGLARQRSREREKERQRAQTEAINRFSNQMLDALSTSVERGRSHPIFLGGLDDLRFKMREKKLSDEEASDVIEKAEKVAEEAADIREEILKIGGFEVVQGKGLTDLQVERVIDSERSVIRSLDLNVQIALLLADAARAEGSLRRDLVQRADDMRAVANGLFQDFFNEFRAIGLGAADVPPDATDGEPVAPGGAEPIAPPGG